jgi:hypothetical protein
LLLRLFLRSVAGRFVGPPRFLALRRFSATTGRRDGDRDREREREADREREKDRERERECE